MPVSSVPLWAGSGPKLRTGLLLLLTSHGATGHREAPWAPWGDTWMQHAIDLRPEIRQAHELRDSVEHGVSPTGVVSELVEAFPDPTGHSRTRQRRRLGVAAPALCPTKNAAGEVIRDSSPFGDILDTDESGSGQISLYDTQAGYASSLFCQWHIRPATGSGQMSLIFDKFDVPIGYDSLKVYQLKCLDEECTKRNRVQMLSFPTGFADAGRLPPLVSLQERFGKPVHMTIRFTSRYASGSSGFIASCRPHVTAPHADGLRRHGGWRRRGGCSGLRIRSCGVEGGGEDGSARRGEGPSLRRLWATRCLHVACALPGCLRPWHLLPGGVNVCKLSVLYTRRYTSSMFDMMDASPILMPHTLATDFYVKGAGFDVTSTLCCKFRGLEDGVNDWLMAYIYANPPDG